MFKLATVLPSFLSIKKTGFISRRISKPSKRSRVIQTFDRRRLSPSDFQDISNGQQTSIVTPTEDHDTYYATKLRFHQYSDGKKVYCAPFPDDTRGFFYLHRLPGVCSLSSQIRFRRTRSSHPDSFDSGQDQCLPNGLPWGISLLSSLYTREYEGFFRLLLRDGLISPQDLLQKPAIRLRSTRDTHGLLNNRSLVLFTLDQPIPIRFGGATSFWVMPNNNEVLGAQISHWDQYREGAARKFTTTGTVLCRFELSDLPQFEGTRALVLRVLSLIDEPKPIDADAGDCFPKPIVGELLPRVGHTERDGSMPSIWSCNVDDCNGLLEPLRYLVDAMERRKA